MDGRREVQVGRWREVEGGREVEVATRVVGGGGSRGRPAPPATVTVTVGTCTRINMNTTKVEERGEGGREGTCSLPNLSLLKAEARARRPHMGMSRCAPHRLVVFQLFCF